MEVEKDQLEVLNKKVKELEDKFSNLNDYLNKNGEIVIDAIMRITAVEKILIEKGLFTEKEIQRVIDENYTNLSIKSREFDKKH